MYASNCKESIYLLLTKGEHRHRGNGRKETDCGMAVKIVWRTEIKIRMRDCGPDNGQVGTGRGGGGDKVDSQNPAKVQTLAQFERNTRRKGPSIFG